MLMGCLAFGSREFRLFQIPVHAWSPSFFIFFLLALFWVLGLWRKSWIFLFFHTTLDRKDCTFLGSTLLSRYQRFRFQRWGVKQYLFLFVSFFLVAWHCIQYSLFFWIICCYYPRHWLSKDMGFIGFWSLQECLFVFSMVSHASCCFALKLTYELE